MVHCVIVCYLLMILMFSVHGGHKPTNLVSKRLRRRPFGQGAFGEVWCCRESQVKLRKRWGQRDMNGSRGMGQKISIPYPLVNVYITMENTIVIRKINCNLITCISHVHIQ